MSVSKYEAFVVCAEEGNFTRAAERMGYTQPAVSQLIRSLEAELGAKLLSRDNHMVELTAEGKELLPYVKNLLTAERDLKGKAEELTKLRTGRVSIGAISSIALRKLPAVIRRFHAAYPGIEVQVTGSSYSEIEELLLDSRIDIGFVSGESLREFEIFHYIKDRLMLVMPKAAAEDRNRSAEKNGKEKFPSVEEKGTGAAGKETVAPEELAAYEFILPAEGADYDIGALFARYSLSPVIRFRMDDDYSALELVRQGFGVTILPELLLEAYPSEGIRAVPIRNTERQISVAVNRRRVQSAAVRTMLQYLRQTAAQPVPAYSDK